MITLVIGHTITNKGASYQQKTYEYDYNVDLSQRIKKILLANNQQVSIIDKSGLSNSQIVKMVKMQYPYCVCELHCNAFNCNFSGSEVLITDTIAYNDALATYIYNKICVALNRNKKQQRGVNLISPYDRGYQNLCGYNEASCLIEPFFIDNDDDYNLGMRSKDILAQAIVDGINKFVATI